jgi:hypothetical protein
VRHFTAAEEDRRLDLVAVGQEALDVLLLEVVVVLVDLRSELDLLTSITRWCFLASRDRFCSWYWYFPKSMMRQTGGTAVGEISTRSSPF